MKSFIENSHPEHVAEQREAAEAARRELVNVAMQIEAHRKATRPEKSQNAWVREWPGLGSQKTYSNILAGDTDGIAIAKKLPDYRAVLQAIGANVSKGDREELYQDLPGAEAVTLAALRLMHHKGKDRLILIEGGSGSGKTSSLDVLESVGAGGSKILRMEADETWKSQRVAMRAMLRKLQVPDAKIPVVTGDMMRLLIDTINERGRIMIAVDEAHHVSGTVLNLFKALLNSTTLMLILAGMNTLFQKLRASASEEAKQLIHNRLYQRVNLAGPDAATARVFLKRRMNLNGTADAWKDGTLRAISAHAVNCGHWSFLRRIVDQLAASGVREPGDAELMAAAESARIEIA